ncbi:hypothetical protein QR98_0106750 [Sarcoptes scabiei]|uniref:Uncharacterized protein n=1 Tax=Sarcoptes scabiei TaxID=52283 RepID=A0A132AM91_SARSC|nr:hypothetical protein QR98_0106750 [Sarcoptes scabiei]
MQSKRTYVSPYERMKRIQMIYGSRGQSYIIVAVSLQLPRCLKNPLLNKNGKKQAKPTHPAFDLERHAH